MRTIWRYSIWWTTEIAWINKIKNLSWKLPIRNILKPLSSCWMRNLTQIFKSRTKVSQISYWRNKSENLSPMFYRQSLRQQICHNFPSNLRRKKKLNLFYQNRFPKPNKKTRFSKILIQIIFWVTKKCKKMTIFQKMKIVKMMKPLTCRVCTRKN